MNLILIEPAMLTAPGIAELSGRHYAHALEVLKLDEREGRCKVGLLNGLIGTGQCLEIDREGEKIRLAVDFCLPPPPPLPVTLVAAMQRPLTVRKVLHAAVTMGVKRLVFIHAAKVEKSYWQSPQVNYEGLLPELLLALEQSVDTMLPTIEYHRRFREFAEDVLPELARGTRLLCAHPTGATDCPAEIPGPVTLLIGPEGGFNEFEVDLFRRQGAECLTLGPRILRTEVAVSVLLAKIRN